MRSASSTLFSDKENPGSHEYSAKNGIVIEFVEEQGMAIIRQKLTGMKIQTCLKKPVPHSMRYRFYYYGYFLLWFFIFQSSYLSGKNSFRVSMSGILPMALPIKKKTREVVIPMVIWCRENTLKPRAMVMQ